jgi:hypothetical protein
MAYVTAVQQVDVFANKASVNLASLRQLPAPTADATSSTPISSTLDVASLMRVSGGLVLVTTSLFNVEGDKTAADDAIERIGQPASDGGTNAFLEQLVSQLQANGITIEASQLSVQLRSPSTPYTRPTAMSTVEIVGVVIGVFIGAAVMVGGAIFTVRIRRSPREASIHKSALLPDGVGEGGAQEAIDRPADWNDYLSMDDGAKGGGAGGKLSGMTHTAGGGGPELLYAKKGAAGAGDAYRMAGETQSGKLLVTSLEGEA